MSVPSLCSGSGWYTRLLITVIVHSKCIDERACNRHAVVDIKIVTGITICQSLQEYAGQNGVTVYLSAYTKERFWNEIYNIAIKDRVLAVKDRHDWVTYFDVSELHALSSYRFNMPLILGNQPGFEPEYYWLCRCNVHAYLLDSCNFISQEV